MFKLLRYVLSICLLLSALKVQAQIVKPSARFELDSIKVGEVVPFTFSYKDRKNRSVIFPDSLYDFAPFELVNKEYYDTESDSLNSIDSAVYFLTTFELDPVQKLSLPVYIISSGDSLIVFSNTDSIKLQEVVTQLPDTLALASTTQYQPVSTTFNYPFLLTGLGIIGFLLLLIILVWGKKISNRIRLYRLKKKLERFKIEFDQEISRLGSSPTHAQIEAVLRSWKIFMEILDDIPYRRLTTREINVILKNKTLEETLKSIDHSIYSQKKAAALQNDFEFLMDYSVDRYNHLTEVIKNA